MDERVRAADVAGSGQFDPLLEPIGRGCIVALADGRFAEAIEQPIATALDFHEVDISMRHEPNSLRVTY